MRATPMLTSRQAHCCRGRMGSRVGLRPTKHVRVTRPSAAAGDAKVMEEMFFQDAEDYMREYGLLVPGAVLPLEPEAQKDDFGYLEPLPDDFVARGSHDYDFSNDNWIREVERDLGWHYFFKNIDDIIFDDQDLSDEAKEMLIMPVKPMTARQMEKVNDALTFQKACEEDALADIPEPAALRTYEDHLAKTAEYAAAVEASKEGGGVPRVFMNDGEKGEAVARAMDRMRMQPTPGYMIPAIESKEADLPPPLQMHQHKFEGKVDPWTLRAKREKMKEKEQMDQFWMLDQEARWDPGYVDLTETNDARAIAEWRGERHDWTHEEIWGLITNDGQNADPWVVRESGTYHEQNPLELWDWAGQGIEYEDDVEEFLVKEGKMWMQANGLKEETPPDPTDEAYDQPFDQGHVIPAPLTGTAAEAAVAAIKAR